MRALAAAADDPVRVLRIEPRDGATGVFRDTPIVASLSHALQPSSVTAEAFAVEDEDGAVPGRSALSADGRCVVWRAERLLVPGARHRVTVSGLRDVRGRTMAPHRSGFVPCDLTFRDLHDMAY
ncbi:MAG TPA: Ig-like domain-containing protein [Vicinamibacteria bacterium]|nr:Ig-like domain-containing protein [Vicinamibacteria bacterium]